MQALTKSTRLTGPTRRRWSPEMAFWYARGRVDRWFRCRRVRRTWQGVPVTKWSPEVETTTSDMAELDGRNLTWGYSALQDAKLGSMDAETHPEAVEVLGDVDCRWKQVQLHGFWWTSAERNGEILSALTSSWGRTPPRWWRRRGDPPSIPLRAWGGRNRRHARESSGEGFGYYGR
jgi:hypothetical protein